MVAGIDVGGSWLHVVVLDDALRIRTATIVAAARLDEVAAAVRGAAVVAIDAPEAVSTAPHATDGTAPNPKFRTARCAEIALGRDLGIWVPWVTPTIRPEGWMGVGFDLFARLRPDGGRLLETYPHGIFRRLAGGMVAPKRSASGLETRVGLLRAAGIDDPALSMWTHDGLDALAAALLAHRAAHDRAVRATCGHDGSAIWLP